MTRAQKWLLSAVVVIALGLVVAVMSWPSPEGLKGRTAGASTEAGGPSENPRLQALRARAATVDAGVFPSAGPAGQGSVFKAFGWGSSENDLGRNRPSEANPEAPMSLTADGEGNVVVLDQVNLRLIRLDKHGKVLGTTPLPVQGAQDLALAKDGTTLVLDRMLDKSVALIGPDGKPFGSLPVEGKGIEEGGAVTGVFTDGDDVYVEREHADLVKLGTTKGKADDARPEVPGRLSRDGKTYLSAGIAVPGEDRVYVNAIDKATGQHRFTREYRLGNPVRALTLLDTDGSGVIYLGLLAEVIALPNAGETPDASSPNGRMMMLLTCLDPLDGRPLGKAELPVNESADETFRELTVRDEGGVLYLYRTETGAELRRYDCR